jgi:uncharacterized protein (TIGR02001 family)
MKSLKLSVLAALLVASTNVMAEEKSELGVSANMAITNNYVWRGVTQSDENFAIQGGIDLDYMGVYAGTWMSSVDFDDPKVSTETDLYIGYAGEVAGLSYDVGYCQFIYEGDMKGLNFAEAYLGLGYDFGVASIGATYYMGVSTDDFEPGDNIEVSASVPLPADISFDVAYGMYEDWGNYYSASIGTSVDKFDVSLAYTGISYDDAFGAEDDTDSHVVLTVGTGF